MKYPKLLLLLTLLVALGFSVNHEPVSNKMADTYETCTHIHTPEECGRVLYEQYKAVNYKIGELHDTEN